METPQTKAGKKRSSKPLCSSEDDSDVPRKVTNIEENSINITDDYAELEIKNLCTVCSIDMGENNPRQLCGKTRCLYKYDDDDDVVEEEDDEFITNNDFEEQVEQEKVLSWPALPMEDIFQVIAIEERSIEDEDEESFRMAQIAIIKNNKGTTHKVWLPTVVQKKLKTTMAPNVTTYMKKKEDVVSKRTKHQYHDANVIAKIKKQR